jgi:hypothetical protein
MQFDVLRAFPYPVLRPDVDDYVDRGIQASVDPQQAEDGSSVTIEVAFSLSVEEIKQLIAEDKASYVTVFSCRETYLRKSINSQTNTIMEIFPAGDLRGEVLISPFVVAKSEIYSFACKDINAEFGSGPFNFPAGAVIAVDRPQMIYIERDTFRPISSCFVLVADEKLNDAEWQVHADGQKVRICVSHNTKQKLDSASYSKESRAILLNSLYLAAVMQCLVFLKSEPGDYQDFRWANVFRQRLSDEGLNLEANSEAWLAQQLMKRPFSLLTQYCFPGDQDQ